MAACVVCGVSVGPIVLRILVLAAAVLRPLHSLCGHLDNSWLGIRLQFHPLRRLCSLKGARMHGKCWLVEEAPRPLNIAIKGLSVNFLYTHTHTSEL